ncbi:GNAT family N-acetyltransferase [Janthinobacterium fluminis]|uniref:GNAT family N-acetyltransferase n=1 Tax=Janthinobacterium fluminis TaxID=2987524 RepID=A0ABT5K7C3_9BURK|nr:GNAT family N-acetyltransferase [Janthinobacterium fluminis]MDC8760907.1 GNAT family N-acetyltransferase [Janthinobacterium fluminis]
MNIRSATIDDYEVLCAIDTVAKGSSERRNQIRDWLTSARCYVAEANGRVAAYGVLTSQFFGHPFIEMVMVGEAFRRQGLGGKSSSMFNPLSQLRRYLAQPMPPMKQCRCCLLNWALNRVAISTILMKAIRKSFSTIPSSSFIVMK